MRQNIVEFKPKIHRPIIFFEFVNRNNDHPNIKGVLFFKRLIVWLKLQSISIIVNRDSSLNLHTRAEQLSSADQNRVLK